MFTSKQVGEPHTFKFVDFDSALKTLTFERVFVPLTTHGKTQHYLTLITIKHFSRFQALTKRPTFIYVLFQVKAVWPNEDKRGQFFSLTCEAPTIRVKKKKKHNQETNRLYYCVGIKEVLWLMSNNVVQGGKKKDTMSIAVPT